MCVCTQYNHSPRANRPRTYSSRPTSEGTPTMRDRVWSWRAPSGCTYIRSLQTFSHHRHLFTWPVLSILPPQATKASIMSVSSSKFCARVFWFSITLRGTRREGTARGIDTPEGSTTKDKEEDRLGHERESLEVEMKVPLTAQTYMLSLYGVEDDTFDGIVQRGCFH